MEAVWQSALSVVVGIVLLYIFFISMRAILSARKEGPTRRLYLEDKLVKELKEVTSGGGENPKEDDIVSVITEAYEDLYSIVSDEEKERKEDIKSLKAEIESLKEEIKGLKER